MKVSRKFIVSSTFWAGIATGVTQLVTFFVIPLFVDKLGDELYGIWVISGILLGYLSIFDFGFTQGLQKYIAEAKVENDKKKLSEVIVSGVVLLFLIGLFLSLLIIIFTKSIVSFFDISEEHVDVAVSILRISGLFSIFIWPLKITEAILSAYLKIKELSIFEAIKNCLQSVSLIILISIGLTLIQIKWITSILIILSSFPAILLAVKMVGINWSITNFRISEIKRMSSFSLGIFYDSLLGLFSSKIDSLIIGKYVSMAAVSIYTIISKLYGLISQVTTLLLTMVTPLTYTYSAHNDKKNIHNLVYQSVRIRSIFTVPISYISILMFPSFILLWVGEAYSSYVIWGQLLLIVPIITCLGVGAKVCKSLGHVKYVNRINTFKILLNFILSIILVKKIGVGGPILGTLVSNFSLGDMLFFGHFCKLIGIDAKPSLKQFYITLLYSSIIFAICYYLVNMISITSWFCFAVVLAVLVLVYFIAIFITCTSRDEKTKAKEYIVLIINRLTRKEVLFK